MYDIIKHYDSVSDEIIHAFQDVHESASVNECLKKNGALCGPAPTQWAAPSRCRPGPGTT